MVTSYSSSSTSERGNRIDAGPAAARWQGGRFRGVHVRWRVALAAALLIGAAAIPARAGEQVTQADLLRRMIDLDRLTLPPPAGERSELFSSFDRRQADVRDGRYIHWDANNDRGQFLRDAEDGWKLMAALDSPGALTRFWCDKPAGNVRIVLDGEAVIAGPFEDLFNGALEPFGKPLSYEMKPGEGANLYFPIGFSTSCRVLCRDFDGEYQIDTVTFPLTTRVQRFQPPLDAAAQSALEEVAKTYTEGLTDKQLFGQRKYSRQAAQEDVAGGASSRAPERSVPCTFR